MEILAERHGDLLPPFRRINQLHAIVPPESADRLIRFQVILIYVLRTSVRVHLDVIRSHGCF